MARAGGDAQQKTPQETRELNPQPRTPLPGTRRTDVPSGRWHELPDFLERETLSLKSSVSPHCRARGPRPSCQQEPLRREGKGIVPRIDRRSSLS